MARFASTLGAGAATAIGVMSSLAILTLLLAGSPNSSPEQWAALRNGMILTAAGGVVSLLAAVVLLVKGRAAAAAWIGALPFLALVVLIAYAS